MSLNCVALTGRLVADPELKKTQSGVSVCSARIAVDRNFKAADGERKADFIDLQAWRGTADFMAKWFRKGSALFVRGALQSSTYDDKNGTRHYVTRVLVDDVGFVGSKPDGGQAAPATAAVMRTPERPAQTGMTDAYTQAAAPDPISGDGFAVIDDSEDLPF